MKILVASNEYDMLKTIEAAIRDEYPDAILSVYTDMNSAKEGVLSDVPDMAFINIDQERGKGKALLEKISEMNKRANLIIISKDVGYSSEAHKVYPSGYIVTPITEEKIKAELGHLRYPNK